MHQVQLADEVYEQVKRRAAAAGYASVDDYVTDLLTQNLSDEHADGENFDHLFTPEVIGELHQIAAEIDAGGKTYSDEEVEAHFQKKREEWLRNHRG